MIGTILKCVLLFCTITSLVESTAWRRARLMHGDSIRADATETVWSIIAKSIMAKRHNSTNVTTDSQNSSKVPAPIDLTTVPVSTSTERTTELTTTLRISNPEKLTITDPTNKVTLGETFGSTWIDDKEEYFFLPDDERKPKGVSRKRPNERERERNTKPPTVKKNKTPRPENPQERRPALLLRLFPDGTAVLISRFQVQLRVKPKEIVFDDDDRNVFEDILPFAPETILTGGKSYEVTYKRLENEPVVDKNKISANSDSNETVEDVNQPDSVFSTPLSESTEMSKNNGMETVTMDHVQHPLWMNETTQEVENLTAMNNPLSHNKTEKGPLLTITEDPFFLSLRGGEMESLQRQYEPIQAETIISTTTTSPTITTTTTTQSTTINTLAKTQTEPLMPEITTTSIATENNLETSSVTAANLVESTEPLNVPGCLSFKNQLSLALSTEDNIGNALLRRYLFPIHDCNTSDGEWQFASSSGTTSPVPPTPSTTISPTSTDIPSTTLENAPLKLNDFPQAQNFRADGEPVMVTSLPMMILLQARKDVITDTPAWKEVTVGVVRDSQGKPIKAKRGYNNWTAHMRNLKKKPNNEFWYETSSPANFRRSEVRDQGFPLYLNNYQPAPIQERRDFNENHHPQQYNIQNDKGLYYNGDNQGVRENALHHQNRNEQQNPRFRENNNVNWSAEHQRNENRSVRRHGQPAEQRGPLRHVGHNFQGGNNDRNQQRRPVGQESRTQQRFANQNRWRGAPRW